MPWLYKYIDAITNEPLYNGLVYKDTLEALQRRLREHLCEFYNESSKWYLYADRQIKILVLDPSQVKTRNDAEMLEGHFIAEDQTYRHLNESKKYWGKSSFINSNNFTWKQLPELKEFEDVAAYADKRDKAEDKASIMINYLQLEIESWKEKYRLLEEQYTAATTELKAQIDAITYRQSTTKSERIAAGLKRAKAEGKRIGMQKGTILHTKKEMACVDNIIKYSKDFLGIMKDTEVIPICGCSKNSYYKYKALAKEKYQAEILKS